MAAAYKTEPKASGRQTWEDGMLRLGSKQKLDQLTSYRTYVIPTDALGYQPGGWLSQSLEAAPQYLHTCDAYAVAAALIGLAENPVILTRLNSQLGALTEDDVWVVLQGADALVQHKRNAWKVAQKIRKFLTKPMEPIRNGTLLCDIRYKSTLPEKSARANDTLSDRPNPSVADNALAQPAGAVQFNNALDLAQKQLEHFTGRIEHLITSCTKVLDAHDAVVDRIQKARSIEVDSSCLPGTVRAALKREKGYQSCACQTEDPEVQFQLAVYLLDANKLHTNSSDVKIGLDVTNQFDTLLARGSYEEKFSALLSEWFLSNMVLLACFVILMLATSWNKSTLSGLSLNRIEKLKNGYRLHGLKPRSGQNEESDLGPEEVVDEDRDLVLPVEIRVIELLMQHRKNVDDYGTSQSDSVFVTLNLDDVKTRVFRLRIGTSAVKEFCRLIEHPHFKMDELRTQSLSQHYLANRGNIRAVQARANHASPFTTMRYVDGSALRVSHEAIIKDYGEILSASFEYASGRLTINPNSNDRKSRLVKTMLLFPASAHHPENGANIADQWLMSEGKISFQIGPDELQQCVYQRKFYRSSTAKLISANPQRFYRYHLPRILFCEALRKVIFDSPLGGQLRLLEENLK